MVLTTVALMVGVGVGTLVVGGGLAWLVTAYRFPLRDVLVWLLVLPLAMPAYILGFVFLSTFDVAGPVQQRAARTSSVTALWMPTCARCPARSLVMTLSLYPYVYLMARAAFVEQSPDDVRRRAHASAPAAPARSGGWCCRWPGRRSRPGSRW